MSTPNESPAPHIGVAIWPGVAAFLAAIASVMAFWAWLDAPTIDPADLVGVDSGTTMLSEPYLDVDNVNSAYNGRPPKAVTLAVQEFDTDAGNDLAFDTQDFMTRHAPEPLCADDRVKPLILEVFGANGCQPTSAFFTGTERYERGLFWWSGYGDPAIGTPLPLTKSEFQQAFKAMREAETALVACSVSNKSKVAAKVTVSPDSGMVPIDGQSEAILDPGASRKFILKTAPGLAAPIGDLPRCAFDRSIASKELNKPYPRWQIGVAVLGGLGAAVTAGVGALKKKDS